MITMTCPRHPIRTLVDGSCALCWKERAMAADSECDRQHDMWKKSEAAAAEMRACIQAVHDVMPCAESTHALSSSCGQDFVPRSELDKYKAACAEMRQMLLADAWEFREHGLESLAVKIEQKMAPLIDCGQDFLPPDKARVLVEALEHYAQCSDGCTCGDGWNHTTAQEALARLKDTQ